MRQIVQGLVTAILQTPTPHFLTDCFPCSGTHRRTEVNEGLTPAILRQTGPECIAQKVEVRLCVISPSIGILTVNYPCFLRVQLQSTLRKPPPQLTYQCFGLQLAVTVAYNIIGVPFEGDSGKLALHPHIKGIVQEQI